MKVWRNDDAKDKRSLIHFEIIGAKVKARQGQPVRHIAYAKEDGHPLVAMLNSSLSATEDASLVVKIEKALNFTVEVRRLAASLWPNHRHAVTPYCFRHQWAAGAKRAGTADAVSRGLGHLSNKTLRRYGTASQASHGRVLRPLEIEAERALGEYRGKQQFYVAQSPEVLSDLRQVAVVESTESSNRLEGVVVAAHRLKSLVLKNAAPKSRSEQEWQATATR